LRLALLVLLVSGGCATVNPVAPTVPISPDKRVEEQPLPTDPAAEVLPLEIPKGEWVEPLEQGSCLGADGKVFATAPKPCPARSGIAVSEERAARDAMYRIRYKELRQNYMADRAVFAAQRLLYETRLNDANTALQNAQPNWFQRHAWELGILTGFVVGAGATVGIVYSAAPAFK